MINVSYKPPTRYTVEMKRADIQTPCFNTRILLAPIDLRNSGIFVDVENIIKRIGPLSSPTHNYIQHVSTYLHLVGVGEFVRLEEIDSWLDSFDHKKIKNVVFYNTCRDGLSRFLIWNYVDAGWDKNLTSEYQKWCIKQNTDAQLELLKIIDFYRELNVNKKVMAMREFVEVYNKSQIFANHPIRKNNRKLSVRNLYRWAENHEDFCF